jgi:hypothetical protein
MRWLRLLVWVAAAKAAVGLAGFVLRASHDLGDPLALRVVRFVHVLVFASVAAWLVSAAQRDRRPFYLGGAFMLSAASSSDQLFQGLVGGGWPVATLSHLHPDAFLALFLWLFFREFPRSSSDPTSRRITRVAIALSFAVGLVLLVMLAAPLVLRGAAPSTIASDPQLTLYRAAWAALVLLALPTLPFALWQTRSASIEERRRFRLFLLGLALGCGPLLLSLLLKAISPAFRELIETPHGRWVTTFVLRPLLITVPISTAYAVLVHRVLNVRTVVRRAIRYALARYSLLLASAVPFALLLFYLFVHRREPLAELVAGRLLALSSLLALGLVTLRSRQRLLLAIDKRFFREQYDAERILTRLIERSRAAASVEELADLVCGEIDRALHLSNVALLTLDLGTRHLAPRRGVARPLDSGTLLVDMVGADSSPLDVDLGQPRSALARLPESERQWLVDGGFVLLVPLLASDGSLIGLLGLGEKQSELPFSAGDRRLLWAAAASAALTLESRLLLDPEERTRPAPQARQVASSQPDLALAQECARCGKLHPPTTLVCEHCARPLRRANVPYLLPHRYLFQQRIGHGGMAVVYRAVDLTLGRPVAVKSLPRVSPESSLRLRREARAMAVINHPNLAMIHGAETWFGIPMLIFEYLEGGTLADRLKRSPLTREEVLDLGEILADVADRIHQAGILHRDIKPTNIAYSSAGTPKLLDFGLAKILGAGRVLDLPSELEGASADATPAASPEPEITRSHQLLGTPAYLSPEAIAGAEPDPSFDLWSIAVVLFEALSGINPARDSTPGVTLGRIARGDLLDIREACPGCPQELAEFFDRALSPDRSQRPATAKALVRALRRLRAVSAG